MQILCKEEEFTIGILYASRNCNYDQFAIKEGMNIAIIILLQKERVCILHISGNCHYVMMAPLINSVCNERGDAHFYRSGTTQIKTNKK